MKKMKRSLAVIADEVRIALRREIADVVKIGELLKEAKDAAGHGNFRSWLKEECALSERTAQRYMAVHRFAAKYVSVADLKLTASALYWLADGADRLPAKVIDAIFDEAKHRLVDVDRCDEIDEAAMMEAELQDKVQEEDEDEEEEETETEEEAEDAIIGAILDGAPPQLPPAPPEPSPPLPKSPTAPPDDVRIEFQKLVAGLKCLAAGPASRFTGAAAADDLTQIVDFSTRCVRRSPPARARDSGSSYLVAPARPGVKRRETVLK
jgi:Protein of unknown function (DUF3102)